MFKNAVLHNLKQHSLLHNLNCGRTRIHEYIHSYIHTFIHKFIHSFIPRVSGILASCFNFTFTHLDFQHIFYTCPQYI